MPNLAGISSCLRNYTIPILQSVGLISYNVSSLMCWSSVGIPSCGIRPKLECVIHSKSSAYIGATPQNTLRLVRVKLSVSQEEMGLSSFKHPVLLMSDQIIRAQKSATASSQRSRSNHRLWKIESDLFQMREYF